MLKITRINHTAITTRAELDEMNQFYVDVLGVQTVKRDIPEKFAKMIPGFWMQFPNGQVHVIQCDDNQGEAKKDSGDSGTSSESPSILPTRNTNPRGPHTAFYVEDIAAAAKHLDKNEILYDEFQGFIFTTDPAGNTVEFQQDPECA